MPETQLENVKMEGVRIIFRNFRGEETKFNPAGSRNFGVVLPDEKTAQDMLADGWPVKYLQPRDEDEDQVETPWISVKVKYGKGRPPKIMLVTSRGINPLNESTVGQLDGVDITNVDLIVRPYHWSMPGGKSGITAYLSSMYVTIEEDDLDKKYAAQMAHAEEAPEE